MSVSESESVFDTPRKIVLKHKLRKESADKKKLAEKFKKVQRQNAYLKKKCASYKSILQNLKSEFGFETNVANDLMAKAEAVELHKSLMKRRKQGRHQLLYSAPLRKFALTLHYYSPAAYKYVRECYQKALPHPRTICRWYSTINAEPGFTTEAFDALKMKCESNAKDNKPVLCSLVFDEISIRRQKLFHTNRKLGSVNFGAGPMQGEEAETVATQALVFMLVALNENWKLPVGYFLTAGVNAETKANLIKICLEKCNEVGAIVASLTFDGCSANFGAVEILGCKLSDVNDMKTYFAHPSTGEKVCIFIDPCHVIKLVRNTFEKKRLLFDADNKQIRWQLLINLHKIQEKEGLRFGNKVSDRHIYFRQQIMKVKLATQLLSMSVAKALLLCDELLKSSGFKDSTGTVEFITLMNNFFDIMNSRKFHYYGFKRPVDVKSKTEIFNYLEKVKTFLLELNFRSRSRRIIKRRNQVSRIILNIGRKKIVESANKTGFIGAIICIESLRTMFHEWVEEKKLLNYISTYRLSQDHLELFFGLIRRHGGYNNNPNILQFRAAYKKTLNHLELRSSFTGNCIPLDNFTILNSASVNVINSTACSDRHDELPYEIVEPTTQLLPSDLEAETNCNIFASMLDDDMTCETKVIVGYISGYVSRQLTKKLKCEECIDVLTMVKKLPHHQLITIKDMGGLCYSSVDVYTICLATEKNIRGLIKQSGGKALASKYDLKYVTINTLKNFIGTNVFTVLKQHALNQPSTFNHRNHLIRAIVNQYAKIRLHHEAKNDQTVDSYTNRNKLTKLILFKGN